MKIRAVLLSCAVVLYPLSAQCAEGLKPLSEIFSQNPPTHEGRISQLYYVTSRCMALFSFSWAVFVNSDDARAKQLSTEIWQRREAISNLNSNIIFGYDYDPQTALQDVENLVKLYQIASEDSYLRTSNRFSDAMMEDTQICNNLAVEFRNLQDNKKKTR